MDVTANALYQVALLGSLDWRLPLIQASLATFITQLGLPENAVRYLTVAEFDTRNPKLPLIALYFGTEGFGSADDNVIDILIDDSITIIPLISSIKRASLELPEKLTPINAIEVTPPDENVVRVANLILESFRLLRRERRLFISYKRSDSESVANQLYNELDLRGFDVFIDTRSVPPAEDFQDVLWHRMADSDLIVLIDTPGFRPGRWTAAELAQANATNVQILHLLWPGEAEDLDSAFSYFHSLKSADFVGPPLVDGKAILSPGALSEICDEAERLRARALAQRYRHLVDNFCDAARDHGLSPHVQAERWISVSGSKTTPLAVVPAIGVPTSDRINEIHDFIATNGTGSSDVWVIFDDRGILKRWLGHLAWLNQHLPIRAIEVSSSSIALASVS